MARVIVAGILAGIALFTWGFLSWVVLTWHNATFRELPTEATMTAALVNHLEHTGSYMIPWLAESTLKTPEDREKATAEMNDRYRKGPIVQIFFQKEGAEPMATDMLVRGVVIDIGIGILGAWIVSLTLASRPTYVARVCTVILVGVFAMLLTHVTDWNFMVRPDDYTLVMCMDNLIGSLVVGLVTGAIVRPPRMA